jgi:hypothetical protein
MTNPIQSNPFSRSISGTIKSPRNDREHSERNVVRRLEQTLDQVRQINVIDRLSLLEYACLFV